MWCYPTKICIIVPTYFANNCVAISISFKFELLAGYVDCRLSELSIVDCRSQSGRWVGQAVRQTDSCCCRFDRLAIMGHCFCLNCMSVCLFVRLPE